MLVPRDSLVFWSVQLHCSYVSSVCKCADQQGSDLKCATGLYLITVFVIKMFHDISVWKEMWLVIILFQLKL